MMYLTKKVCVCVTKRNILLYLYIFYILRFAAENWISRDLFRSKWVIDKWIKDNFPNPIKQSPALTFPKLIKMMFNMWVWQQYFLIVKPQIIQLDCSRGSLNINQNWTRWPQNLRRSNQCQICKNIIEGWGQNKTRIMYVCPWSWSNGKRHKTKSKPEKGRSQVYWISGCYI